jgi:hypothetical protein
MTVLDKRLVDAVSSHALSHSCFCLFSSAPRAQKNVGCFAAGHNSISGDGLALYVFRTAPVEGIPAARITDFVTSSPLLSKPGNGWGGMLEVAP